MVEGVTRGCGPTIELRLVTATLLSHPFHQLDWVGAPSVPILVSPQNPESNASNATTACTVAYVYMMCGKVVRVNCEDERGLGEFPCKFTAVVRRLLVHRIDVGNHDAFAII